MTGRYRKRRRTKAAITLVELVVAMVLTVLFATACILLILPVESIYTHTTDLSRAQLLADTIADSIRAECADSYITGPGDVWIGSIGNEELDSTPASTSGEVLIFRKRDGYCETIFANGEITEAMSNEIASSVEAASVSQINQRAIFRLFEGSSPDSSCGKGYVHFGYYESTGGTDPDSKILPYEYYDFTNPFPYATYRGFNVDLNFSNIQLKDNTYPAYAVCKITIKQGDTAVYSREAVICFAGPVQ